jgi:hypothetical protein
MFNVSSTADLLLESVTFEVGVIEMFYDLIDFPGGEHHLLLEPFKC